MSQETPSGDRGLDREQVEAEEAVEVPARDDMSMIATEPTGSKHGDAEGAERLAGQAPSDPRPGRA